ncbi:MAG: BON domain-containing protein [Armatimonadota bacterium]
MANNFSNNLEYGTLYGSYGVRPGIERPDEEIKSEVYGILRGDPSIDISNIQIFIQDGVVMLSGVVESEEIRQFLEEDVWDISGIVDVHNELQTMHDDSF